ncbi:unnamed protein product [Ilex paraguariensis]|uniref:Uncharacterized protein n=1 Tax=Ilex paraguariensis TaxID=185542 RepID=A0ABC8TMX5_9AQUA
MWLDRVSISHQNFLGLSVSLIMGDGIDLQNQEAAEETLSLSNLPLITTDEPDSQDFSCFKERRSSSEPTDFFEFFSDFNAEMRHAEDIIFCGKLVPFKENPLPNQIQKPPTKEKNSQSFHRRRSESFSEQTITRTESSKTSLIRSSRSLDSQTLLRNSSLSSETSEIHRNSSVKSSRKSDGSSFKVFNFKPRWYLLTFGLVKFPPEMALQDIKNRQVRRNPGTMFPSFDAGKKVPGSRRDRQSFWGLLRVLSCKDDSSVAVTTSFTCMPQV